MAVDTRTNQLMTHFEGMMDIIADFRQDMLERCAAEQKSTHPREARINFYNSQLSRLDNLETVLEEDVLEILIRIRNISGPIEYFPD
jgi:hypothetical protein